MFIAHLPFGYMAGRVIQRCLPRHQHASIAWALAGSVFPDIDLIYCYLADGGRVHHHHYWTHLPFFWLVALVAAAVTSVGLKRPQWLGAICLFGLNVFGHLLLDTNVGDIWWFYPFIDKPYAFFHVPVHYHTWWANFILHWTFLEELGILALCFVWLGVENRRRPPDGIPVDTAEHRAGEF